MCDKLNLFADIRHYMMGFVLPLIGFIVLFLIIYALIDAYPKLKLNIPSPPSIPIIGHLHKVIGLDTERKLK